MSDLMERGMKLAEHTQLHNKDSLPSTDSRLIFELCGEIERLEKELKEANELALNNARQASYERHGNPLSGTNYHPKRFDER